VKSRGARHATRVLFVACTCALAALALMSWQLFDPRPFQVIVAMSAGQLLGTISLFSFIYVVVRDLRPAREAARKVLDNPGMQDP
jgi:hypothetical protein